ncbi:MAG: alpha-mannosidase [Chloroflexota bacterium]
MGQAKTLVVVPHTHWDREWYRPFQDFRARLVQTVDRILDLMDSDPEYAHFSLDGQTVVLEDYLEIRPEQRERLERLIRTGRILVGPWYILPDEFLVSGEALIRNLLRGDRIAGQFGAKMNVGYLPDQFGHIAQMPQILRGAGLDAATLWRGVPAAVKQAEFEWQAPDGSQVFCIYLPQGYGNAAQLELSPDDLKERLHRIMHDLEPFQVTDFYLLMNGSDHLPAQPGLPAALAAVEEDLRVTLRIGTLPQYIEAVRRKVTAMPRHVGELRSPARAPMLVGCSSARIGLKQRNHRLETLLTHYAEPLAAWTGVLGGGGLPQGFLREAWKLLLQNQPHDSICGCSIDQVHREMETRYDWADQITSQVVAENRQWLADQVDTSSLGGHEGLLIWNPTGARRTDIVTAILPSGQGGKRLELVDPSGNRIPVQSVAREGRDLFSMRLSPLQLRAALAGIHTREIMGLWCNDYSVSRAGDTAVIQLFFGAAPIGDLDVRKVKKDVAALLEDKEIKQFQVRAIAAAETTLIFRADDLPAHGWSLYRLEQASGGAPAGVLQASPEGLENDFYRVGVNPDGSLTVLDKETGVIYPAVNQFVDGGDRGDEYTYCPPDKDQLIAEPQPPKRLGVLAGKLQGRVVEAGPVRATIELSLEFRVPASLAADRSARSKDTVTIPITTRVSLIRGLKRVDFNTTVDNTARDHRLRVQFTAPYRIDGMSVETQYGVIHRDLDLAAGDDWPELPTGTAPVKTFVTISDGHSGLTVINRGLPEHEAIAGDNDATIALTLIRAVGWLSREDLKTRPAGHAGPGLETPEAQCLGTHSFDYALTSHRGGWNEAMVWRTAHDFNQPVAVQPVAAHAGALPASGSFVAIDGDGIVLAAVKPADDGDGIIVRVYNTTPRACSGSLTFFRPLADAVPVDLLERAVDMNVERVGASGIKLALSAWRIASYRCRF